MPPSSAYERFTLVCELVVRREDLYHLETVLEVTAFVAQSKVLRAPIVELITLSNESHKDFERARLKQAEKLAQQQVFCSDVMMS